MFKKENWPNWDDGEPVSHPNADGLFNVQIDEKELARLGIESLYPNPICAIAARTNHPLEAMHFAVLRWLRNWSIDCIGASPFSFTVTPLKGLPQFYFDFILEISKKKEVKDDGVIARIDNELSYVDSSNRAHLYDPSGKELLVLEHDGTIDVSQLKRRNQMLRIVDER